MMSFSKTFLLNALVLVRLLYTTEYNLQAYISISILLHGKYMYM